ncbi:phospholipase A1 member A-like isoform X2 [Planococcus citri]|uniref:phospholipase A1 member A-like isoform X2 n=1 Tax=Planococcus citri TaxID=170843 RepID=UPI0031FA3275
MFRVFVLSLLVAAASANDSQLPTRDQNQQNLINALKLNQDQIKSADEGEQASPEHLAYEAKLGLPMDKISCKGLFVEKNRIKFTLYSMPSQNITWDASQNVKITPYFDPELPTQILISSRLQSEKAFQPAELAFTYGIRGNKMNVISVNWDDYANCFYLQNVIGTVPELATIVSDMIKNTLVGMNGMDYDKLRLTGFGFGAHIAGLAARKLPKKPARITALDPSGLLFSLLGENYRLKKGDAKFIDVIMTNRGVFGMQQLVGDINFLPSGGRIQKACENKTLIQKNTCSHRLALEYYIESANKATHGFVAKPATSWTDFLAQKTFVEHSEIMGEAVSQKYTGNYYLEVNAQRPYSRGVNGAYLFTKASVDPYQKGPQNTVYSQNELPSQKPKSPIAELQSQAELSQQ